MVYVCDGMAKLSKNFDAEFPNHKFDYIL
ncbi:hypothetical protein U2A4042170070 [Corynebacterium striatum]|nr:hypothetical protein U2A4042170070 [Corynebacterium striatum]